VHGDFVTKNVRVRSTPGGLALLVFDWELSGWGTPAEDLARFTGGMVSPDLAAYCSARLVSSLRLDVRDLERLSICGELLRLINEIAWETSASCPGSNAYEDWLHALCCLGLYEPRLAEALQRCGWVS
jgi:aminoglycoside phosphotransferase (APT) family kinase protein